MIPGSLTSSGFGEALFKFLGDEGFFDDSERSPVRASHDVFGQVFPEKRYGVFPAGHGFFEELVVGVVHFLALSVPMHQCKNHPYRTAET
jgi:hypothetical protein